MVSTFATQSLAPLPVEQPGPVSTVLSPGQGELTCGPTTWEGTGSRKVLIQACACWVRTSFEGNQLSHGSPGSSFRPLLHPAGLGSEASLMSLEQCQVSCEFLPLSAGCLPKATRTFQKSLVLGSLPSSRIYLPSRKQVESRAGLRGDQGCWGQSHIGPSFPGGRRGTLTNAASCGQVCCLWIYRNLSWLASPSRGAIALLSIQPVSSFWAPILCLARKTKTLSPPWRSAQVPRNGPLLEEKRGAASKDPLLAVSGVGREASLFWTQMVSLSDADLSSSFWVKLSETGWAAKDECKDLCCLGQQPLATHGGWKL